MKKILFGLLYILWGGVFTANADVTIYVNSTAANYYVYAWDASGNYPLGDWGGKQVSSLSTGTVSANDSTYYYYTFKGIDVVYIIFNKNGSSSGDSQTSAIQVTEDTYFNYYGGTSYWSSADIITVCVNSSSANYYMYAWDSSGSGIFGSWPGKKFSEITRMGYVDGTLYYYCTFLGYSSINFKFAESNSGSQTSDITGITPNSYSYFTYSGGTTYTTNQVKQSIFSNDTVYYLVCGNSKFKFTPDRVRNGNTLDYNCQNLHLQDFVISGLASGGSYSFHIEDASGNTYYPGSGYTSFSSLEQITGDTNFDAYYSDSTKYYWIGMEKASSGTDFSMPAGTGKSYTFLWERATGGIRLIVNGEEFGDAAGYYTDGTRTTVADYYLIGNFSSASADTDIDPSTSDNRRMLTPYYYKNGNEYGGSMTDCDSIVYKIEVARPSAGWSELYLDLVNKSDFDTISTWVNNEYAWQRVIRPESSWLLGTVFAYDATALTGGLMRNENSSYQSLNPVVSDTIDSYVFTMNAKTSTYSIRFVSAASNTDDDDEEEETTTKSYLYIFGTAVGSSDGSSTTSDNWSGAKAFKLTYNSDGGYYYYAGSGETATETAIPMVANGKFAFVTDMDFSKGYYTEDGNEPPSLIEGTTTDGTTTYTSTESSKYGANTAGGFYETQYVNMLGTNRTAEAAAYSESIRTITWGLPSGDYYIRFYVGAKNGEYAKNLYTVRRSYRLLRPDAKEVTINGTQYTTFKVFCDSNAVIVPSDVDVLYVPEITSLTANSNNTSSNYTTYSLSLKKYSFTGDSCVIPANTPVILAMTTARTSDSGSKLEADTITLDYYSNTIIKWTDISSTSDAIASAMTPSIPYEAAPNHLADDGSYNFVFGYRKLNDTDTKPTIGFYYPTSGNIAINGAYLNVDSEYFSSGSSAKEAALVFYSDLTDADETDGSETTGINNALAAGDADADGAYYTLQGMRIAKPTVKGIYIHNGKKMIVK